MTCRKIVEGKGAGVAFLCDLGLPEGHDGPCAAKEKPATVSARQAWEKENAAVPADESPGIEMFQDERRAVDRMVAPESISPYPGERGFPRHPVEWQVHHDTARDAWWAFVPVINRWMPVHTGEVDQQILDGAPRTITVTSVDGNTEQRVILPDQPWAASLSPRLQPAVLRTATEAGVAYKSDDVSIIATSPNGRIAPQPDPEAAEGDVWSEIIEDMADRRQFGIDKYGTPLQRFNGRNAMVDAYQETLDLLVYLRQASGEREIIKAMFARVYGTLRDLTMRDAEARHAIDSLAQLLGVIPATVEGGGEDGGSD